MTGRHLSNLFAGFRRGFFGRYAARKTDDLRTLALWGDCGSLFCFHVSSCILLENVAEWIWERNKGMMCVGSENSWVTTLLWGGCGQFSRPSQAKIFDFCQLPRRQWCQLKRFVRPSALTSSVLPFGSIIEDNASTLPRHRQCGQLKAERYARFLTSSVTS